MNTRIDMKRRRLLAGVLMLPFAAAWAAPAQTPVEVWKDASCGSCKDWIAHLEKNGFAVRLHETGYTDSPGMDGPAYNNRKDPYHVPLVKADGSRTVYQSYR